MHPELLSALAAEHRRDLAAISPVPVAGSAVPDGAVPGSAVYASSARAGRRARSRALPRFHVSWTRTTLAAVAGRRRARSLVIVISATRTW